jgi:hypothetical protein
MILQLQTPQVECGHPVISGARSRGITPITMSASPLDWLHGEGDPPTLPRSTEAIAARVSPLPQRAHERLAPSDESPYAKCTRREQIDARLASASDRRRRFLAWASGKARRLSSQQVSNPAQPFASRRGLEAKLEAAEKARRSNLDEQVEKARGLGHRAVQKAARKVERQRAKTAERIHNALSNAAERRQSQLERESERLARRNRRVKEASQAAKQRRADKSKRQSAAMEEKLRRAAHKRNAQKFRPGSTALKEHKVSSFREKLSSKVLQRNWRSFKASASTTRELASAFSESSISIESAKSDDFDAFARKLQSRKTLFAARALLQRLSYKLQQLGESTTADEYLLKRVRSRSDSSKEQFPVRVVLCAFMIVGHPEAVFNGQGDKEQQLREASLPFAESLEALIQQLKTHGPQGAGKKLRAFGKTWDIYLERFVAWKVHDAADLEADLIRTAGELKSSAIDKIPEAPRDELTHDQAAVVDQVQSDLRLLRDRVHRLAGEAGVQRLDGHLAAITRAAHERKQSVGDESTDTDIDADVGTASEEDSEFTTPAAASVSNRSAGAGNIKSDPSSPQGSRPAAAAQQSVNAHHHQPSALQQPQIQHEQQQQQQLPPGQRPLEQEDPSVADERFVHELLHDPDFKLPEVEDPGEYENEQPTAENASTEEKYASMQRRMKAQMHRAFWDSIASTIANESASASEQRVIGLMEELRSELADVVPPQRRSLVDEQLNAEELRKALGALDTQPDAALSELRRMLASAARLLKDLGAPARDEEVQRGHDNAASGGNDASTSKEAAGKAIARALKFLFHQAKVLKRDTANAQVAYLRNIVRKGNMGTEWVRKRFAKRYEIPMDTSTISAQELEQKLPRTFATLGSTMRHVHSLELDLLPHLNAETVQRAAASSNVPSTMATGLGAASSSSSTGNRSSQNEEQAPPVQSLRSTDAIVRLAVVELVQEPKRLDLGRVPETMMFDTERLVEKQNHFQQLIVQAACLLVYRQLGGNEDGANSLATRVKALVTSSNARLNSIAEEVASEAGSTGKAELAESLLKRLTNPEDAMFKRVTSALGSALRALVLLGRFGQQAANEALARCAAGPLLDEAMEVAQVLLRIANVSLAVHRPVMEAMLEKQLSENGNENSVAE